MIRVNNCENLSTFVKVTAKILSVFFFPDAVYYNFVVVVFGMQL